jgi:TMEM175 potassium channel family protein
MSTNRLEAFSDGVIAIAITLLVLEIDVPAPGGGRLGHELAQQWPSYAGFVVSFVTIGIIWVNHHGMVARVRRVTHAVLVLNLLLLMAIAILPFTTALMAEYLREPAGESLAAAIYAGSLLVMGLSFYAMQRYLLVGGGRDLVDEGLTESERLAIRNRNRVGVLPYAVATALAPLSAYLSLAICAAVAAFYALPFAASQSSEELGA